MCTAATGPRRTPPAGGWTGHRPRGVKRTNDSRRTWYGTHWSGSHSGSDHHSSVTVPDLKHRPSLCTFASTRSPTRNRSSGSRGPAPEASARPLGPAIGAGPGPAGAWLGGGRGGGPSGRVLARGAPAGAACPGPLRLVAVASWSSVERFRPRVLFVGVFPEGGQQGRVRRASGGRRGAEFTASGVPQEALQPGDLAFPPDLCSPRAPLAPLFHPPESTPLGGGRGRQTFAPALPGLWEKGRRRGRRSGLRKGFPIPPVAAPARPRPPSAGCV